MSVEEDDEKLIIPIRCEDESGTAGLERASGTTCTSTGMHERTRLAPAMPDTGNLHYGYASRYNLNQRGGSLVK